MPTLLTRAFNVPAAIGGFIAVLASRVVLNVAAAAASSVGLCFALAFSLPFVEAATAAPDWSTALRWVEKGTGFDREMFALFMGVFIVPFTVYCVGLITAVASLPGAARVARALLRDEDFDLLSTMIALTFVAPLSKMIRGK